jgi:Ca2+-binding RTX toxin-like protein
MANINGTSGNDWLFGTSGDDVINGLAGADIMLGGAGNDTYIVDNTSDFLWESSGNGTDLVQSSVTFTLGNNLENMTLTGSADINGTGNSLNNTLTGNSGANVLSGGGGADTLAGGTGSDSLGGGSGDDTYVFNLGDGVDTVTDTATGGEGNSVSFGAGLTAADVVLGFSGGFLQLQFSGGDELALSGFDPNDAYGAHAVETYQFADGTTLSYADLMDFGFDFIGTPDNDTMTGTSAVDIFNGYEGDDTMTGGGGNDELYGGRYGGTDTMNGGAGNDTYLFTWGDGTDTINDTALPGEGNVLQFGPDTTLNDLILSYSGGYLQIEVGTWGIQNDMVRLSGFDPNDAYGAHAVDTFVLDNGTSITYQDLIDFGFDFGGTAGDDTLTGTSAPDFFNGEAGNDTLIGGAGNDTYTFLAGGGQDTIVDTDSTGGNSDRLFLATANPLDLIFSRQANDLRIAVYGSSDQVTVQDWYLGAEQQLETIEAGNGDTLLNTQVEQLIQAMATFSQQTGLTWEQGIAQQPQQVQTVLAGSWQ